MSLKEYSETEDKFENIDFDQEKALFGFFEQYIQGLIHRDYERFILVCSIGANGMRKQDGKANHRLPDLHQDILKRNKRFFFDNDFLY